jgi:hypothetical protein
VSVWVSWFLQFRPLPPAPPESSIERIILSPAPPQPSIEQIILSVVDSANHPLPALPVPEDMFGVHLLSNQEKLELSPNLRGDYERSTAKYFLDLARATYDEANMFNGQVWKVVTVNPTFNLKVIGRISPENEIDLGFRGSVEVGCEGQLNVENWLCTNFNFFQTGNMMADLDDDLLFEWDYGSARPRVYSGFLEAWRAVRNEVHRWLDEQRQQLSMSSMTVRCCGHSLGGALSTLCALELAKHGYGKVELITWASPRVGDAQFVCCVQKAVQSRRLQIARFVNGLDVVPKLPPDLCGFKHVCEEIRLDAWVRAITVGPVAAHSLTTYATNLANCFRNPLSLVSTVETAAGIAATPCVRYVFQCASMAVLPYLMGPMSGPVCHWLIVNNRMLTANNEMTRAIDDVAREAIELKKILAAMHGLIEQATSELKLLLKEQRDQDKVDAVLARVMTLSTASRERASLDSSHPAMCNLRDACNTLFLHLQEVVKGFLSLPKEPSSRKRLARQVDVMCIGFLAELQVIHKSGDPKRYEDRRLEIANQLRGCLDALVELNAKGVFNACTECVSVIFVVQLLFERPWPELVIARARARICVWVCVRLFSRALVDDRHRQCVRVRATVHVLA